MGAKIPKEPILFIKATSAIVGPNDNLIIPKNSKKTDWEVELGVVINPISTGPPFGVGMGLNLSVT
jgi:2-keto-4-pentenoate hydratase/2-oxohepta-3-ene-1,7-dioic acid hydratase in catechol pathway